MLRPLILPSLAALVLLIPTDGARSQDDPQDRGVTILRGDGYVRLQSSRPEDRASRQTVVGGETLWILDEEAGLIGCRVENSIMVGERRVVCARSGR